MAFQINNNINAMSAYSNVKNSNMDLNKSMAKLSSGLRINQASDDPAGLISSELFRSQISSMDSAMRNNQEAGNYAKTAENALGEMNKLLSDARGLAVASGNSATLTSSQTAANQDQLNSIISSINRISSSVTYSGRKLLDGSAGTTTQISDTSKISGFSFGGSLGSASVTTNNNISVAQTTAATRATISSTLDISAAGTTVAGSFAINGVSFNAAVGTTGASLASTINSASNQTGVTATYDGATGLLAFNHSETGSGKSITFSDTTGVISTAANTNAVASGTDAVASVTIGGASALFTGGRGGTDGLTLSDASGNTLKISEAGNAVSGSAVVGKVIAGDSSFQIGFQSSSTANLSLRNMSASQLGAGVVAGKSVNNLDISTAAGANSALQVLDKAIEEVSSSRGRIGNFQRNVLETNNRTLSSMRENLAASESSIRDLDVADEMTKFTKYQVMQQAGMAMLGQANQSGQAVLGLLRG
jgi:flagellin